ncbi:MAG: AI-2E family transporter, partial [Oscillospiraceae bacterium]|nr:AI-2E family transporter [Oscillospiraceae bacterium]
IGLVSAVLPQILESVTTLANNTNFYIERIQEWDLSFLNGLPEVQGLVSDFINDAPTQITLWLQENVLPEMNSLVVSVGGGIWSTIGALFDIILGLFVSIYLLYGKELFAAQGKKVLYATAPVHTANVVVKSMRDIHKKFGGFITGKLIDSMIVGALFFVTLTIFNIPYPVLISVVLGITNIIPFFGPFIGAIPASLLILMVDPMKCLYFIIIVLIIQQIDGNWLGPKIVGDSIGLSSFWVIFAIVVGQRLFGFIGLVVGIPIFSFLYALAKARVTRILEKKELPSDSDFYRKVSHLDSETGEFVLFDESEKPKKAKEKKKFNFFMKKKG